MIGSIGSSALEGMQAATRTLEASAQRASRPERALESVERDVVAEKISVSTYKANAAVIKTADEMVGATLDLVG